MLNGKILLRAGKPFIMTDNPCDEILDHLFDGVYYVDRDGVITLWNKAAERLTGYAKAEVIGTKCSENILRHITEYGLEVCTHGCPLQKAISDGCLHEASLFLHHKQGHRVPVYIRISPLTNPAGEVIGAVEVFSDHSKTRETILELEQLKKEVLLDPLLKIGNRRFAEMVYATNIYQLCSFKVGFSMILLDIDHFKKINDTYGHKTGDDVLLMVSRTLSNILRHTDTIIRWGGDEFLMIFPNLLEEDLINIIDRIKKFVELSFIIVEDQKVSITVSGGATLVTCNEELMSVFDRIDHLLYQSKEQGRNRITLG